MLTWDEEVKPSSQKLLDGGLQNNRPAESPSALSQAAAAPAESLPTGSTPTPRPRPPTPCTAA